MRPPQTRKTRKVRVRRNPFTTVLDGKRRMPGIRHQFALRGNGQAELLENPPILLSGSQHHGLRSESEGFAKFQGDRGRGRLPEHPGICHDPHKPAQDGFGKAESRGPFRKVAKVGGERFMLGGFFPVGVNQDVHIAELHGARSPKVATSSAAKSSLLRSRSIFSNGPSPRNVTN